jgi:hypothetical protein
VVESFDYIAMGWNVLASVNKVGEHLARGMEVSKKAMQPLPTDLIDDEGEAITTAVYPDGFIKQSDLIRSIASDFSGNSISNGLISMMMEEEYWDLYYAYPKELSQTTTYQKVFDVVIQNRAMFGFDTSFVYRGVGQRVLTSVIRDENNFQFKHSNIVPPPRITMIGNEAQYWRPPTIRGQGDYPGIDFQRDVINRNLTNRAFLPGACHVRPFMIGPANFKTTSELLNKMYVNATLSIPAISEERKYFSNSDLFRMDDSDLVNIFRFDFVQIEHFDDFEALPYTPSRASGDETGDFDNDIAEYSDDLNRVVDSNHILPLVATNVSITLLKDVIESSLPAVLNSE